MLLVLIDHNHKIFSASYFLRQLLNGSYVKARGNRKKGNRNESDKCSMELQQFYIPLLDHGALWKLKNKSVICTAMPYGDLESIKSTFDLFIEKFKYPKTIKMQVLDESFWFSK